MPIEKFKQISPTENNENSLTPSCDDLEGIIEQLKNGNINKFELIRFIPHLFVCEPCKDRIESVLEEADNQKGK